MIDTERKEDLFLDTKLIKSENKLGKLRIIDELHPVLGGQPTHEADQPNDNNPFLDLACTMQFTIDKVNAVDKKADTKLAKAQNLKDVANVAIARDNLGLGTSATMNATSTLSDRTDQTATIKVVNDVNRAASTAQKTANNAHALAQSKQDKLTFVGDGRVLKEGAYGLGGGTVTSRNIDIDDVSNFAEGLDIQYLVGSNNPGDGNGLLQSNLHKGTTNDLLWGYQIFTSSQENVMWYRSRNKSWLPWNKLYSSGNTTPDKSGFLRASGSANAVITTDLATKSKTGITRLDSSLSDAEDRAATPKAVNDVNRAASTAQKTANNAHALAQSKQDKLPFVGDGPEVMKTGAFGIGGYRNGEEGYTQVPKPSEITNVYRQTLTASMETDNEESHTPRIGQLYGGITFPRALRPGEVGVSGRGSYALLHYRGFSGPTSSQKDWHTAWGTSNTTTDKSGFLRASGNANALVESDVTNSLGNSKSLVASQFLTSDVAQKATNAHYRADEAYDLANSKWSPQATTGTGNIARMSEVQKAQQMGGLGYGQSWQNVTGSRSVGATYTNNTGKPIMVLVTGKGKLGVTLNGIHSPDYPYAQKLSFIVPPGGTYRYTGVNQDINVMELR